MGTRQISGYLYNSKTCKHEGEVTYTYMDGDSPLSGKTCTDATIVIDQFKGWGKSYYFDVYIGGQKACETVELNDQDSSDYHELLAKVDMKYGLHSDVLFGKSTRETLESLDDKTLLSVFDGVPTYEIDKSQLGDGVKLSVLGVDQTPIFKSKS